MGMYDSILVSKQLLPLTDEERKDFPDNPDFQTKDLDCSLSTAEITLDGYLRIWRMERETVPKEERPYPNDESILQHVGSIRPINKRLEDVTDENLVTFYTEWKGKWYEFDAIFDSGKLVEIKRSNNESWL